MAKPVKKRKANPALLKPLQPDDALSQIVGSKPLSRGQVMKKVWEYIKAKDLQDAKDRRKINADDKLRVVLDGQKSVSMFELTKFVSKRLS